MTFNMEKIARELKPDMFQLLQERGIFSKKKRSLTKNDIERILDSSLKKYKDEYDEYVADSLKNLILVLKEKDSESMSEYITDRIGKNDIDSFVFHLLHPDQNTTTDDTQTSEQESEAERKIYPNVLDAYYLDPDRFKNSNVLIQSLIGDDELTLSKYGRIYRYENTTLEKKNLSRDDVSKMITLQLAQILVLIMFLRSDERFKETYKDLDKRITSKDESLMKRFGQWYPSANEIATDFFIKNKNITNYNPYDAFVEKIQNQIRDIKHGQEDVEDDEIFTISDDEREELNKKHMAFYDDAEKDSDVTEEPKQKKYIVDGNDKEQEIAFAESKYRRRNALFDINTFNIAKSYIDNPEKIETVDVTDFRDLKTIITRKELLSVFIQEQYRNEKTLQSYQNKILAMTRSELKKVLSGLKNNENLYNKFEKAFMEMIQKESDIKDKDKDNEFNNILKKVKDKMDQKETEKPTPESKIKPKDDTPPIPDKEIEQGVNDFGSSIEDEDEDISNALKDYLTKESISIEWRNFL